MTRIERETLKICLDAHRILDFCGVPQAPMNPDRDREWARFRGEKEAAPAVAETTDRGLVSNLDERSPT